MKLSQYGVHAEEIKKIRALYTQKLEQIPALKGQPRYFHFYHMLKDKIPEIAWNIKGHKNGRPIVNFNLPLLENLQPSILSILLDRVTIASGVPKLLYKYKSAGLLSENTLNSLEKFIHNTNAILPTETNMGRLAEWITTAQSGKQSTIFIITCPDYSAEPIGHSQKMYRHTFKSLGSGIGQIAKRILNILPDLKMLLEDLEIKPTIVTSIADYEAFSEGTLKRMNLSKSEFLKKVDQSRLTFEQHANKILNLNSFMFTDLCGGEDPWLNKVEEIKACFEQKKFGYSSVDSTIFLTIAKCRKNLYQNWFNLGNCIEKYLQVALNQAVEYATIGFYITRNYPNCLVLGADSVEFAEFYNFNKTVPNLYFKRFYC